MTAAGIGQIVLYGVALVALGIPLGAYMARVYTGEAKLAQRILGPFERVLYRIFGIKPDAEMSWKHYAFAVMMFNLLGILIVYLLQRVQHSLPGNPLVFINACESGELRPEFYDGFIPYFMAKGARGVVGTECKTPAIFASEWALRFFPRFLDGEPLGDLFLELRREFHTKHGNPLGLLYNVYCDADTRIQPGLTI